MRISLFILALALFCASTQAISETNNATSMRNLTSTNQVNESAVSFTILNLTRFGEDHPPNPATGLDISQVALGHNGSINLVQMIPGSILKMHYHGYRDEMAYMINGEAVFTVSGKNYTAKAGDLLYIPALTLHRVEVIGNETFQAISIFAPPFDGKDRIFVEP